MRIFDISNNIHQGRIHVRTVATYRPARCWVACPWLKKWHCENISGKTGLDLRVRTYQVFKNEAESTLRVPNFTIQHHNQQHNTIPHLTRSSSNQSEAMKTNKMAVRQTVRQYSFVEMCLMFVYFAFPEHPCEINNGGCSNTCKKNGPNALCQCPVSSKLMFTIINKNFYHNMCHW